jgi:hypothetical protein
MISGEAARAANPDDCSQHRGLAYHNLKKCEGDLADAGSAREDLIGAPAEVSALVHRLLVPRPAA